MTRFLRQLLSTGGLALLAWLPVYLHDLLGSHPPSLAFSSPVVLRGMLSAFGVCAAIVLLIACTAALFVTVFDRRVADRTPVAGAAFVLLASSSIVALHAPIRAHAPEGRHVGLTLIVALACLATVVALALIVALPAGARRFLLTLSPPAAFVCWAGALYFQFSPTEWSLLLFGGSLAGLTLWIGGSMLDRARSPLLAGAVAVVGIGVPVAAVLLPDPGLGPRLSAPDARAPERAPNVVLFVIDTLRSDHTEPFGYPIETTPYLARALGSRATVFTQATATAPSTQPSMNALFTSRLPTAARGVARPGDPWGRRPPEDAWTVASAFREAGFETAGFSANGLISGPGYENGYRWFHATLGFHYFTESFLLMDLLAGGATFEGFRWVERWHLQKEEGSHVVDELARWLEASSQERPFFAYVHLLDPHWPYYDRGHGLIETSTDDPLLLRELLKMPRRDDDNSRFRETPELAELTGRYDEEIRWADSAFGSFLDVLKEQGMDERTMVVIVGDHGEEFFEHGSFGHGHDVYQPLVHVPLVVLWPDEPRFAAMPERIETPVSLLDVFPTLADYFHLPPPPGPLLGHSLRPLLERTHAGPWHPVVSEALMPRRVLAAYREGPLKVRTIYRHGEGPEKPRREEVFDLAEDPAEASPLPESDPRVASVIERSRAAHQRAWADRRADTAPSLEPDADVDEDALERLRALGYIQ